jgi:hypothetical protein
LASGSDIARFRGSNDTGCTLSDGGVIACSSDLNLKKNISDLDVGIEELLAIRPVNFQWKSEDNLAVLTKGFIAQEVELVFPDLVRNDSVGHKTLNQIGLIPVIIQAIKDMWQRLEDNFALDADQSAEIEALRARIEQLEAAQGNTAPEVEIENNEEETGGGVVVDNDGTENETNDNTEEVFVVEEVVGEEIEPVVEDESEVVTPEIIETEESIPEVPIVD